MCVVCCACGVLCVVGVGRVVNAVCLLLLCVVFVWCVVCVVCYKRRVSRLGGVGCVVFFFLVRRVCCASCVERVVRW